MRVIGIFTAWGCEDWAPLAIQNHLKICDEIYVAIEPHCEELRRFKDNTFERIVEITDDRIKFLPKVGINNNPIVTKCDMLNLVLEFCEVGDILMLCDSDEFYDDGAVVEIQSVLDTEWDMLRVKDRFFCINFDWYVGGSHGRFWKIKTGARFYPSQHMMPDPIVVPTILENHPMFHYSMLTNPAMREVYWEAYGRNMQAEWQREVYMEWDLNATPEEMAKMAFKCYQISGVNSFWFNKGNIEQDYEPPYLLEFHGEHPVEELRRDDFRCKP